MPRYDGPEQLAGADPGVLAGFFLALEEANAGPVLRVALVAAGIVEASLTNPKYGDRDSVGSLQQRAGWGPRVHRMDPHRAALAFIADARGRVLPRRPNLTAGRLAQAVQRSAFPFRYTAAEPAARYVLAHAHRPPV